MILWINDIGRESPVKGFTNRVGSAINAGFGVKLRGMPDWGRLGIKKTIDIIVKLDILEAALGYCYGLLHHYNMIGCWK